MHSAEHYRQCLELCESCLDLAQERKTALEEEQSRCMVCADWWNVLIMDMAALILELQQKRESYLEALYGVAA